VNEFIDRAESALDGSGHHSPHRTQRGRVPARVRNRSSGRYNRRQGVYCPDSADVTVIAYRRWVSRMRPNPTTRLLACNQHLGNLDARPRLRRASPPAEHCRRPAERDSKSRPVRTYRLLGTGQDGPACHFPPIAVA
jgi:hypothetical protein